ncbi:uncharacterized protein [Onthophagus taurus]|uniref:uncharacterized protein n=1 Tax=Onthophagus taurus TaxID=166361 RepID=UPI000C20CBEB|nr:uncharacterized protein LOC111425356 isoform X1 [Onthophagus taurus]XP_022915103.1 uncharacterized protein LOC111425356 isoform X2 [Onthophagus taurus]XP_022915104.1 uncharacterized protein LOC111425356 isoform X3 [Onthophagus taurus]
MGKNSGPPSIYQPRFLQGSECMYCNGFYGSCFDEHVCQTCHAFLYPVIAPDIPKATNLSEEDDSDSGNDEPADNNYQPPLEQEQAVNNNGTEEPLNVKLRTLTEQLTKLGDRINQPIAINIDQLPPEVLIHAIQFLDDISLWSFGQVNQRWRSIMLMYADQNYWKRQVHTHWPLLNLGDNHIVEDWHGLYTTLMNSSCCIKCIQQMSEKDYVNEEESSWRKNRLRSELRALRTDAPDGIQAIPLDGHYYHWQATIIGSEGSCYEGGTFFLYIQIPCTYPMSPPRVRFLTKIFHPNISRHGDIGIDSINTNWSLALTISKVLISIQSILTDPVCDVCMEREVGQLYLEDRTTFEEEARRWTWKYAMHSYLPN